MALGDVNDPRGVEPLIAALKDKYVAPEAERSLYKMRGRSSAEPLIALLKDPDPAVRRYAVDILLAWDPRADPAVRRYAVDILLAWNPRAVEPLIAASKDPDSQVRRGVIGWLASQSCVEPRAFEALAAALSDPDVLNRQIVAKELADLSVVDPRALSALLTVLEKRDIDVIFGEYDFFIRLGKPGSEDSLIEALNKQGDKDMAQMFLFSGNSALEFAGRKWAVAHNIAVVNDYMTHRQPTWGSSKR